MRAQQQRSGSQPGKLTPVFGEQLGLSVGRGSGLRSGVEGSSFGRFRPGRATGGLGTLGRSGFGVEERRTRSLLASTSPGDQPDRNQGGGVHPNDEGNSVPVSNEAGADGALNSKDPYTKWVNRQMKEKHEIETATLDKLKKMRSKTRASIEELTISNTFADDVPLAHAKSKLKKIELAMAKLENREPHAELVNIEDESNTSDITVGEAVFRGYDLGALLEDRIRKHNKNVVSLKRAQKVLDDPGLTDKVREQVLERYERLMEIVRAENKALEEIWKSPWKPPPFSARRSNSDPSELMPGS